MTVEELIADLQKYPSYLPIFMKITSPNFESGGVDYDYFKIEDTGIISNFGDIGRVVVLIQAY